jgi:hypothetical protein
MRNKRETGAAAAAATVTMGKYLEEERRQRG